MRRFIDRTLKTIGLIYVGTLAVSFGRGFVDGMREDNNAD